MYRFILFDLDGTISDPKVGICTSVQHALTKMGIEAPDIDELEPFIGPPLRDSFMEFFNMTPEEAEQAITYYRERFSTIGKFENELYPGITELLRDLKKKGRVIAIASSKPTVFVEDILKHFEIREYFDVVVGSELDGSRDKKEDVLKETLRQMFPDGEIDYDNTVMIGDRRFDIEAALTLGTLNIGVSYGYGSREELEAAGADKIVNTVEGLRATLLPMVGEDAAAFQARAQSSAKAAKSKEEFKEESKSQGRKAFANIWAMIGPAISYKIGSYASYVFLSLIAATLYNNVGGSFATFFDNNNAVLSHVVVALSAIVPCLFLIKAYKFIKKKDREKYPELPKFVVPYEPVILGVLILLFAVGINGWLISYNAQIAEINAQRVAEMAAEGAKELQTLTKDVLSMPLLILLYGIIIPVCEQFIFTGLTYRRSKAFLTPGMALIASSFIYSVLRADSSDSFIGFVIFAIILYAFSIYPNLWYSIILSVCSSTVMLVFTYMQSLKAVYDISWFTPALMVISGVGIIFIYTRHAKAKKQETIQN